MHNNLKLKHFQQWKTRKANTLQN